MKILRYKRKKVISSIIMILLIDCLIFKIIINRFNTNNNNNTLNDENFNKVKGSGSWILPPIAIDETGAGDYTWAEAALEDWCNGSGTLGDPYVIENVIINGLNSTSCLEIRDSSVYFRIENCTFYNSSLGPSWSDRNGGIELYNTNNGQLINNNCSNNNGMGIFIRYSDYNTVSGNIINNNKRGIYCYMSYFNKISRNIIKNSAERGFYFFGSGNNTISQNFINNPGDYGILFDVDNIGNTISGNVITGNSGGIILDSNSNNTSIFGNNFKNNGFGIKIYSTYALTANNLVYNNSFIGSADHAYDDGVNNDWDNGNIGNYWDDYTGSDTNVDGIGDTPYAISGPALSVDNYPIYENPTHIRNNVHIDGNGINALNWANTALLMWWCTGSGTSGDPYIINGLIIDGGGLGSCILIENSNVYFMIVNSRLYNSSTGLEAGIKLSATNNGQLINNNCSSNSGSGIILDTSDNQFISGNTIADNTLYGINLVNSDDASIYMNTITGSGTSNANDTGGTNNQWDNGTIGNYWDDYGGVDANDDGIGDTAYTIPGTTGSADYYPIWSDTDDIPVITINSPTFYQIFGDIAPSFDVYTDAGDKDTTWYILNYGLAKTFTGLTGTINQTLWDALPNGSVIIRFYINDTAGNIGFSEVLVYKNTQNPTIIINSPLNGQFFANSAPTFDLTIIGINLDSTWYTINNGLKKYIFVGTSGTIDQTIWDTLLNGTVVITFYVNDTVGNLGYATVIVNKQIFLYPRFFLSLADYTLNMSDYEEVRDFKNFDLLNNGRDEIIIVSTIWNSTGDTTRKGLLQIFDFQDYTITLLDSLIISSPQNHTEFFQVNLCDIDDDGTIEVVITGAIQNQGWSFIQVYNFTTGQLQFETETSWYFSYSGDNTIYYNDMIFADFDDDGTKEICTLTSVPHLWDDYGNRFHIWNLTSNTFLLENQFDFQNNNLELDWRFDDNFRAFDIDMDNTPEILLFGAFNDYWYSDSAKLWALNYTGSALNVEAYTYWSSDNAGPTSLGLQIGDFDDDGVFEILAKFTSRDALGDNLNHACYRMAKFLDHQFITEFGQTYFVSGGGSQYNGDWIPNNLDVDNEYEFISTDLYLSNYTAFLRIWDYQSGVLVNTESESLATDCTNEPPHIRFLPGSSSLFVVYSKLDATGYKLFFTVIGDYYDPEISINSPAQGEIFSYNAPGFDLTILEANLNSTWYTIDDGATNFTFIGTSGIINQTAWEARPNGTVTIIFFANDSVGNEGFAEISVYKDIIAPSITIISPLPNQLFGSNPPSFDLIILEGNLDITWYTLDGGLTNYTFIGTSSTINQAAWEARPNGTVTIIFFANDSVGNEGFAEISVYKDIIAPSITIISPLPNQLFGSDSPSFDFTIQEGNLDITWYTLDGGLTNYTFIGTSGSINQAAWDSQPNGTVTIMFFANDSVGNEGFAKISVYKDIIAPSIIIISPLPNQLFGSDSPSFDLTIQEGNLGITWYTLDGGLTNYTFIGTSGTIIQAAWDSRPNGTVIIMFFANDSIGNLGFAEITVYKQIIAPSITINSPTSNQFFGSNAPSFDLTILGGNLDITWYTLDGGLTNYTFIGTSGTINQAAWDVFPSGTILITFYANDTVGNTGYNAVSVVKDIDVPTSYLIFIPHSGTNIVNRSTTFNLNADDGLGSGISRIRYKINNSDWIDYVKPFNLSNYEYGDYLISYQSIDMVGNIEDVNSFIVQLVEIPSEPEPDILVFIITGVVIGGIAIAIIITVVLIRKRKK